MPLKSDLPDAGIKVQHQRPSPAALSPEGHRGILIEEWTVPHDFLSYLHVRISDIQRERERERDLHTHRGREIAAAISFLAVFWNTNTPIRVH